MTKNIFKVDFKCKLTLEIKVVKYKSDKSQNIYGIIKSCINHVELTL